MKDGKLYQQKSFLILISFFFFVTVISGVWYWYTSQETPTETTVFEDTLLEQPTSTKTTYYVLVTALHSNRTEISLSELEKTKIYSTNKPQFSKTLDYEIVTDNEALLEQLYNDPESTGLVPFEELTFKMRSIPLDGQDIFDKELNLSNYYLQETKEVSGTDDLSNFNSKETTKIITTGEIILARGVAERIEKYGDVLYPFHQMKSYLESADLTVSTLEAPILSNCRYCEDCMVFCGEPEYLEGLSYAGIDGVTMAANHVKDFGSEAISETMEALDNLGIAHFGVGMNYSEAHKPWIVPVNGVRFGFLGFNDVVPESYAATETSAGSAWANIEDIKTDVAQLRDQVDVLIMMPHWGVEYTNIPNDRQKEIAHIALEAGVDLIIGDHPHWVQGVEFYQDKFVIYGVGNFVFDQMWSQETQESVVLDLLFYGKNLKQVRFHPIVIEDYAQPRFVTENEGQIILERIWDESDFGY